MAISSGVAPHKAFLNAAGGQWPLEHGTVTQDKTRGTSVFAVYLPMSLPGAYDAFAGLSSEDATVTVMAHGSTENLLVGRITKVRLDMISRTIGVEGCDNSRALHHNKTSEKWQNQNGPAVVGQLVGRVGMPFQSDGGSGLMVGKKLQQDYVKLADNVSYAYVIHKIAEMDGSMWWVDRNGIFNYKLIGSTASGGYSIRYQAPTSSTPMRSDAMLLQIDYDVQAGKTITHTTLSWHPKMKQMNKGQHTVPGRLGSLSPVHHIPTLEQDHADQYSKAKATEMARHELTVTATVVGDPSIDIGEGLSLSGTGPFDQSYEIDRIIHTFGYSGYTMDILARAKAQGQGGGGTWSSPNAPEQTPVSPSGVTPGPGIQGPPGSPSGPPAAT